ncbi:MAG: OmpA family protein [Bacteroidales bacterium]|nr:OmpA family protein [Bacteroidales bacterium]MDD4209082.1 OmpA family protein [Bacteroidales bacterium]
MKNIFLICTHLFAYVLFVGTMALQAQPSSNQNTESLTTSQTSVDSLVEIYVLRNIYFDFGSKELLTTEVENLEEILHLLKNHPPLKLEIIGHTDNKETQSLSISRAYTIYQWFINHGIEKQYVTYKSMGAVSPIVSNSNPEYRQLNRRVEFTITK